MAHRIGRSAAPRPYRLDSAAHPDRWTSPRCPPRPRPIDGERLSRRSADAMTEPIWDGVPQFPAEYGAGLEPAPGSPTLGGAGAEPAATTGDGASASRAGGHVPTAPHLVPDSVVSRPLQERMALDADQGAPTRSAS